jgi:hypothetical protein
VNKAFLQAKSLEDEESAWQTSQLLKNLKPEDHDEDETF